MQKKANLLFCTNPDRGGTACKWSNNRIAYTNVSVPGKIIDITEYMVQKGPATPWGPKNELDPYIP
jgi:hypothetical protein